jgi:hypothetical protein
MIVAQRRGPSEPAFGLLGCERFSAGTLRVMRRVPVGTPDALKVEASTITTLSFRAQFLREESAPLLLRGSQDAVSLFVIPRRCIRAEESLLP